MPMLWQALGDFTPYEGGSVKYKGGSDVRNIGSAAMPARCAGATCNFYTSYFRLSTSYFINGC